VEGDQNWNRCLGNADAFHEGRAAFGYITRCPKMLAVKEIVQGPRVESHLVEGQRMKGQRFEDQHDLQLNVLNVKNVKKVKKAE
jgi:hypothetical protein